MFKIDPLIITRVAIVSTALITGFGIAQAAEVKCPDAKDLSYTPVEGGNYLVKGKTTGAKQVELEGKFPARLYDNEGYKPTAKKYGDLPTQGNKIICIYTKGGSSTVGALTLVSKD